MIKWKNWRVKRTPCQCIACDFTTDCIRAHALADALDECVATLRDVQMYLGPSTSNHVKECEGCEYEWTHALDAATQTLRKIGVEP